MAPLSPMMAQYFKVKEQHKDHLLFYRLGDFYEMFYDDAKIASKELELTLTGRDCGQEERAPMCGVPYHSCETYIARLIQKGYKVAICEQMENPAEAKGVVRREVVRVVTPGTVIENSMLDEGSNNYISGICIGENAAGICFCDVSTGELKAAVISGAGTEISNKIIDELSRFTPKEILFNEDLLDYKSVTAFIKQRLCATVSLLDRELYEEETATALVCSHFGEKGEEFVKQQGTSLMTRTIGALLSYLAETQMNGLERLRDIEVYTENMYMNLDMSSKRNLELTENMARREKRGSLLWVLDKTCTAMGKRLLKSYVEQPLINAALISRRLGAVEELFTNSIMRGDVLDELMHVFDIERIMTRIVYGSAGPREYKALEATLGRMPNLKGIISTAKSSELAAVCGDIEPFEDVTDRICRTIKEDPPVLTKDGGYINDGFDEELDELRSLITNTKEYIASIEQQEREKTGIKNLKIGYNRVFGYYIEVTRLNSSLVPDDYIRKQTLANSERYITQELKQLEERILSAGERSLVIEQRIFAELREEIKGELERIQQTANAVARLDVLCSFAQVAARNGYCKPVVDNSDKLIIKDGRHPVVEAMVDNMPFVANDVDLDCGNKQISVITGPNMAGKSTYMRQVALITLMAQIGSFVPARSAHIGVVDGIYTRVGASDDLTTGQSTFMVEMSEVASILKNCTSKSLLILDEIGRGTSTFDGMSIARAVIEHIANKRKCGAKTLFATHYHQLTEIEQSYDNVKNFNIAVKKRGDDIVFLRRIVPGGVDDSYGIEVSKLAGIPDSIIKRAHEILNQLEEGQAVSSKQQPKRTEEYQMTLMSSVGSEVEEKLKGIDLNTYTPLEALNLLYELKAMIKD
ncbi:MAG: DNA mismatch repair protein MutS [Oscillospiraceae bacterium]|nr:DNA mismatch repair protein MutS [Oscillospiraceae bacterium]